MGNTITYEPQAGGGSRDEDNCWHGSRPNKCNRRCDLHPKAAIPKAWQSKRSSFLDDPVTNKLTERGEATVSVGAGGNTENGRDGHGVNASNSDKLRYAVSEMQGWRSHMEDKHALNPKLSSNRQQMQLLEDHHIFAVFDGHGGDFASHFCGEQLVPTLIAQKQWQAYLELSSPGPTKRGATRESVTGMQLLKSALTATFLTLDAKLMEAQRQRRLSQLIQIEDYVYSLAGNVEYEVFQPGTADYKSVINFSKKLPPSMPVGVALERSGSTGVVVLITPSHILCANAGDSRAILSKKTELARGGVLPLSFDHKPNKDVEVCRVERNGGFVRTKRVDGDLAVSRGFGDFAYKNCPMDYNNCAASDGDSGSAATCASVSKDHRITVHPDIIVHTREPNKDEFIVLACDGIWDRLTNQDCANLVRSLVHDEGETDVGLICEEVVDTSFELDSRDNMTCCVVLFPAAKINQVSDTPNSNRGVMQRRIARKRHWGNDSTPAKRAQSRLEERRKKQCQLIAQQQPRIPRSSQSRRQRQQPWLRLSPSQEEAMRLEPQADLLSNKGINQKAPNSLPNASRNKSRARSSKSLRLHEASVDDSLPRQ